MNIKKVKVALVSLIFVLTTGSTVLASTARYSQIIRSKINSISTKTSSRTVSYSTIHRTRKLRGFKGKRTL